MSLARCGEWSRSCDGGAMIVIDAAVAEADAGGVGGGGGGEGEAVGVGGGGVGGDRGVWGGVSGEGGAGGAAGAEDWRERGLGVAEYEWVECELSGGGVEEVVWGVEGGGDGITRTV